MPTGVEEHEAGIDQELLANLRERLEAIVYDGEGRLAAITVTPSHDVHVAKTFDRVAPGVGLVGDGPYKKHWHGKLIPNRHISAINAEVLDALGVGYDVSGDNLVIRGIDLAQFEAGDSIKVGDAVLVATGAPFVPCAVLARRTSTAHVKAIASGRLRGTFFDAVDTATIQVGDPIERLIVSR